MLTIFYIWSRETWLSKTLIHVTHADPAWFFWPMCLFMPLCRYNQVNAISLACRSGVEGCQELTTGWFREWMRNPSNNRYALTPNFSFIQSIFPPYTLSFAYKFFFLFWWFKHLTYFKWIHVVCFTPSDTLSFHLTSLIPSLSFITP